ncbi:MAG: RNA-binding domain-containing protein [Nitrososphaerota archaeon]
MVNQLEIVFEVIIHATEDKEKILDSIEELFEITEQEFVEEKLAGHFGNPILLLKARLSKKRAEYFVKRLISRISKLQFNEFLQEIDTHFEDSSLFLRVSKQEMIRKLVSLQQNDAVKIKISIPIYKKKEIIKTYLEILKP